MRIPTRSRSAVAVCTLALGLVTACGTSDDDADADLPTLAEPADAAAVDDESGETRDENAEEVDPELAFAEYEKCMEEQGVDMSLDEAGSDGGGAGSLDSLETFDEDTFDAATHACDPILEDAFGDFQPSPEEQVEIDDQLLEMQKCLDERGFDIDLDGGEFAMETDDDGAEFEAAMQACQPEFVFESDGEGGVDE